MKYFRFFIFGTIVFLIVQSAVLLFLEKVYFADNASYSSKQITDNSPKETLKSKIYIDKGYKNISYSNDGKYVSYLYNSTLEILNLGNGEKTKVYPEKGADISNYKWVYDRSRIILAEKTVVNSSSGYFKFYYYDLDNTDKVEIFNNVNNKTIKITVSGTAEKISDIEMSTLTNVIYVKTSDSKGLNKIFRINIMAQQDKLNTITNNIGRIVSLKKDDTLIYEDFDNGKVYKYGSNTPIVIKGESKFKLLGVDDEDNVYLALMENNKTNLIYFGNLTDKTWKKYSVNNSVGEKDIFVNNNGKVFINDSTSSILSELGTNKETNYSGSLIGIYNAGLISEKNNEIITKLIQ